MSDTPSPKHVCDSAIHDQTSIVFPNDLNSVGTLFGGRVMEQADRLAAVVAKRHSGRVCVTLGVDSVRFLAAARRGDILVFQSAVNRVWRSSMEIGVKVFVEDVKVVQRRHIFSAYFTFVAVDDDLHPVTIPQIVPQSDDERRRYEQADRRRAARLAIHSAPRLVPAPLPGAVPQVTSLYEHIPGTLPQELLQTLLQIPHMRIERIISQGQASPDGFWYDQETHEWVLLLQGAARLQFEGEPPVDLQPGAFVNIPAHRRHRVDWTDPDQKTIWLGIHYDV